MGDHIVLGLPLIRADERHGKSDGGLSIDREPRRHGVMQRREEAQLEDKGIVCDRSGKRQDAIRVIDPGGLVFRREESEIGGCRINSIILRLIIRTIEIAEENVLQVARIRIDGHGGRRQWTPKLPIASPIT